VEKNIVYYQPTLAAYKCGGYILYI